MYRNKLREHVFVYDNTILEMSSAFDLSFSQSGSWDYTAVTGLRRNLSAATVTFWMQSSDSENQGTPLSYATDRYFNALTLTDYSGYVS